METFEGSIVVNDGCMALGVLPETRARRISKAVEMLGTS